MSENRFVQVEAFIMHINGATYLMLKHWDNASILKSYEPGWEDCVVEEREKVLEFWKSQMNERE